MPSRSKIAPAPQAPLNVGDSDQGRTSPRDRPTGEGTSMKTFSVGDNKQQDTPETGRRVITNSAKHLAKSRSAIMTSASRMFNKTVQDAGSLSGGLSQFGNSSTKDEILTQQALDPFSGELEARNADRDRSAIYRQRRQSNSGIGARVMMNNPWFPPKQKVIVDKYGNETTIYANIFMRIHELFGEPGACRLAAYISIVILALIFTSCICFVAETLPSMNVYKPQCEVCAPVKPSIDDVDNNGNGESDRVDTRHAREQYCAENNCEPQPLKEFDAIETVSVIVFTIEYICRFFTAWATPCYLETYKGKYTPFQKFVGLQRTWVFFRQTMNLIDLVAIVPFYIPADAGMPSTTFLRIMRLFRVLKLLKIMSTSPSLAKFSDGMLLVSKVFQRAAMSFVIVLMYICVYMIFVASLVFVAEQGSWDPRTGLYMIESNDTWDQYSVNFPTKFVSIPTTMWWVFVTVTTVGYGDLVPYTKAGQFLGVFCMMGGVILFALPVTIIGGTFQQLFLEEQSATKVKQDKMAAAARIVLRGLRSGISADVERCFGKWRAFARTELEFDKKLRYLVQAEFARQNELLYMEFADLKKRLSPDAGSTVSGGALVSDVHENGDKEITNFNPFENKIMAEVHDAFKKVEQVIEAQPELQELCDILRELGHRNKRRENLYNKEFNEQNVKEAVTENLT